MGGTGSRPGLPAVPLTSGLLSWGACRPDSESVAGAVFSQLARAQAAGVSAAAGKPALRFTGAVLRVAARARCRARPGRVLSLPAGSSAALFDPEPEERSSLPRG